MRPFVPSRRFWTRPRLAALTFVLIGNLLAASVADPQTSAKIAHVGVLGVTPSIPATTEMFKQGLAQLGFAEGQQVELVFRHADSDPARLPAVAADLVRTKPDVIFARGPAALAAAAGATRTIPIAAIDLESDPLALGYAKTLARPGGQVTGVFLDLPEMSAKQLQLFREIVPKLSRVALVGDPVTNAAQYRATEEAAKGFKVKAQRLDGRTVAELDAALEAARRNGVEGVMIFSSPIVYGNVEHIATLAREKRLPTVALFGEYTEAGGLMSYGPNLPEAFRRCGVFVAKILSGTRAGDLPIERPEKFELVINARTAKALGLRFPDSMIRRADKIIE